MSDTLKDLYDRRGALQGLLLHPGWKVLCEEAGAEREKLLLVFCQPLRSMEEAPAQEFSKGRAYQLSLLASVPQALIDNLTIDIETITQENGNGSSDADPEFDPECDSVSGGNDGNERAP